MDVFVEFGEGLVLMFQLFRRCKPKKGNCLHIRTCHETTVWQFEKTHDRLLIVHMGDGRTGFRNLFWEPLIKQQCQGTRRISVLMGRTMPAWDPVGPCCVSRQIYGSVNCDTIPNALVDEVRRTPRNPFQARHRSWSGKCHPCGSTFQIQNPTFFKIHVSWLWHVHCTL